MITNTNVWNSPVRKITAKVELLEGSTQVGLHNHNEKLKSFSIDRVGDESKFFGFGVCQKLNVHLIDTKRELDYGTQHSIKCYLNDFDAFPSFKITEIHRDENTNEISITAYDALYWTAAHTVTELALEAPYTITDVANSCAALLGISTINIIGVPTENNPFNIEYPEGANLEGTETLRELLDDIAEATQTVYYIDYTGALVFKRPDVSGDPVLTISKADYIELNSKTNRRLSDICSATELGDNVITESGVIGTVQYVRDNAFWELRDDIATLLNNALAAVSGMTINQFDCSWRGNPALEIGDKIAIVTKDDKTVCSYLYDDTIEYEGHLAQKSKWDYADNDGESADNPVSLGDALRKTFARVDKANKEIELLASRIDNTDTGKITEEIANIKITTDSITQEVERIEASTEDAIESLSQQVSNTITAEDATILIQQEMSNGVDSVLTETGYVFNKDGLTISKSGSEITTTITEDGMTVRRNNDEVLVADNLGVRAEDLHATTFLIIGVNSRFEDYDNNTRTGCFWIGQQGG